MFRSHPSPQQRYSHMARRAASEVIGSYSTSFGSATRLLPEPQRTDIRNLYAVVRIADEIVDGAAPSPERAAALKDYEQRVRSATATTFPTDPILHAFADTARRCNFDDAHLAAFFTSMRHDVTGEAHTEESVERYIYGSAEVIGLLCVDVFFGGRRPPQAEYSKLQEGARALGAAFQKVNFLRDYADDTTRLARNYFPQARFPLRAEDRDAIIADIQRDFDAAWSTIPALPKRCGVAVAVAANLFEALTDLLGDTPPTTIRAERVRVSAARKAAIIARTAATGRRLR